MALQTEIEPIESALRAAFPVPAGHIGTGDDPTVKQFHKMWRWRELTHKFLTLQSILKTAYYMAVFLMIGWLVAQYLDYRHPVSGSMSVVTREVEQNSEIKVLFSNTYRHRVCDVTVSWIIWDGRNEVHPFSDMVVPGTGESGAISDFTRGFWIGSWAPGSAKLRVSRSYSCPDNYVHDIKWAEPDMYFTILPKKQ